MVGTYRIAHKTHVGLVRDHNEDRVRIWRPRADEGRGPIVVIADGLGGHAAGEVASEIAVSEVIHSYEGCVLDDVTSCLREAVLSAHRLIQERADADAKLRGMGTTCTTLAFAAGRVHMAHVGDSRAYRLRDQLEQLTQDHTVAQELADDGVIRASEVEGHMAGHILTRALGQGGDVTVDTMEPVQSVEAGDRFLLCSDGLTGHVSDQEIEAVLAENDPQAACDRLVEMACEAGGSDNITIAIVHAGIS